MKKSLTQVPFWLLALVYFTSLALLLFGDALWDSRWVISAPLLDIDQLFYPLRAFAFGQMRDGHLPLWNPYVMGGIPALGNSLYAILYPPNWLHLLLPMNLTINLLITLHVMLCGLFTAIWCRSRGASAGASLIAGSMFMFCGPLMLRIYGGILTYPCVIAWTPLLLLCIDRIIENRRPGCACFAGGAILTLQVLAGYMLTTYFQVFGIACYVLIRLINHPRSRPTIGWLLLMGLLGGGLSAVQFLPGIEAAGESVRGIAQESAFSTSVSLPPENLLSLIIPYLFGDWVSSPIFQRWGIVDTSVFIGAIGTTLALIGAVHAVRSRSIRDLALLGCLLVTLAIALGEYNPLYVPLMRFVPGLALFRGPSRASFMITLPAAALAASGFDHLLQSRRLSAWMIFTALVSCIFSVGGLLVLTSADQGFDGLWGRILLSIVQTGETWYKLDSPHASRQIQLSALLASQQILVAAAVFALFALTLSLARTRRTAIYLLLPIALIELWCGSVLAWDRFKPTTEAPRNWRSALTQLNKEDRVLVVTGGRQNLPMQLGIEAIGGYDPALRQRWENVTAGLLNSEIHSGNLAARRFLPSTRWPMLRLATLLPPDESIALAPPMPRLNLIDQYSVVSGPDASLLAVRNSAFDPHKTVILEQTPSIKPAPDSDGAPAGTVELVAKSTDQLEVKATLTKPSILLVTDAYSRGWRVSPTAPTLQSNYEVLPANHALMAIPLMAGSHHFTLEYWPTRLTSGLIISTFTACIYAGAFAFYLKRRVQKHPNNNEA